MSPLVTAAVGALSTVSTIGGALILHWAAIKKEYVMVRTEISNFITSVEKLEAAVVARLAQPGALSPEETAALADATAKADALTASLSTPPAPQ